MSLNTELPYLNVQENAVVALEELFSYDQITIPAINVDDPPDDNFYILNIKIQFICVTKNEEKSTLYVKKPTIEGGILTLIKTSKEKKQFDKELDKTVNNLRNTADGGGKDLFNAVYKKIETEDEMPVFSKIASLSQGGKKGGGTRKVGGSRSR
tara:strand:+ start:51 stop:512 length:462 start_codon:yes stop_codon:yes gene_type:complete